MSKNPSKPAPIADLLDQCLGPSLMARGFTESHLISSWPEIIGSRLSLYSRPVKIEWKKLRKDHSFENKAEPATLIILVESAFALELQHMVPTIIERVNALYGWRCIKNVVLKQGNVARPKRPQKEVLPLSEEAQKTITQSVQDIPDDRLKNALIHLGEAVLATKKK